MGDPIRSPGSRTCEPLPEDLQLPFGVSPEREGPATTVEESVLVAVGGRLLAVGSALVSQATPVGRVVSGALRTASAAAEPLGWAYTLYQLGSEVARLPVDADVQAFLRAAAGGDGPEPTSNWQAAKRLHVAAATAAVLLDMDDAEVGRLRDRLAGGATFDDQYALAQAVREDNPTAFAEAAERYREMVQQWQGGVASAIEGWAADRGPIFGAGRQAALQWLRDQPFETQRGVRHRARRAKNEAVVDVARGQPDARRLAREPHYRSGVHHAERVREEGGAAALEAEAGRAQQWLSANDPSARGPAGC
jgi:hypothetical protein